MRAVALIGLASALGVTWLGQAQARTTSSWGDEGNDEQAKQAEAQRAKAKSAEEAEKRTLPPAGAPSPSERHYFRLGIGTGLTFGISELEERSGDSDNITGMFQPYNLSVTPSFQLTPHWAFGVRGGVGTDSGARGTSSTSGESVSRTRTLWELGAEGRYQMRVERGGYVALNFGTAGAVDSEGSASASQWAPMLGAALGYDLGIAEPLSIGVEVRGGTAFFGEDGAQPSSEGPSYVYGTSSWLSFNLTGHFAL
jgi:hypothetical protein